RPPPISPLFPYTTLFRSDVAQRSDRVVEMAAVVDAEVLGHRDLHRRDVVRAPDRLEHRVGEAEVQDLLGAHLPEVVVDPVEHYLDRKSTRLNSSHDQISY